MELLKESDFRKEIKTAPRAGYLFFGDEDYLKAFAVRTAREVLCPDPTFAFFNEMKLDALDFTPDKLLDALMPMPMMADRKLILVNGLNFNTMRSYDLESLLEVLEQLPEYDYNVVIFHVASDCLDPGMLPKRPSTALSRLAEHLTPVQFERCTTAKLAAWVQKHFAHNGVQADAALCTHMIDYCGHGMFILAGEIDKLCFYLLAHEKTVATVDALHLVCTPINEYDTFAFTNAIMEGKSDVALGILSDYRFRRVEPLIILGDVIRVICEMISVRSMSLDGTPTADMSTAFKPSVHEFRIKLYQKSLRNVSEKRLHRALDACNEADLALKRSSIRGYAPLEKLICTL